MTCASSQLRSSASTTLSDHASAHFPSISPTSLKGVRIGIPLQTSSSPVPIAPSLLENLQNLGAQLVNVSLPSIARALPAYYVLASAEASSNLARYGGGWFGSSWEADQIAKAAEQSGAGMTKEVGEERRRRIRTEGFGREVKKRILAGTYALSAE